MPIDADVGRRDHRLEISLAQRDTGITKPRALAKLRTTDLHGIRTACHAIDGGFEVSSMLAQRIAFVVIGGWIGVHFAPLTNVI
jgi:hypothetical protein